jgi:hypothetical protein
LKVGKINIYSSKKVVALILFFKTKELIENKNKHIHQEKNLGFAISLVI